MNTTTQPLNITINGNDIEDTNSSNDTYQNYVIQMNQKLQKENIDLVKEIAELNNTNDDLEEQLDKEEKSKTYMKGLLQNVYEMKTKALEISVLRKRLFDQHNLHTKNLIKKPFNRYFHLWRMASCEVMSLIF